MVMPLVFASSVRAEKKYDTGASDTEIKIGQTMPYSGPVSAFSVLSRVMSGYFKALNDKGGIHGRKINFVSVDDGYNPSKTVEQTRRLVEEEGVLAIFAERKWCPGKDWIATVAKRGICRGFSRPV